jgi:hypothetical protein
LAVAAARREVFSYPQISRSGLRGYGAPCTLEARLGRGGAAFTAFSDKGDLDG